MPYITSAERIGQEKAQRSIAMNLLEENADLSLIARATKLSLAKIKELQKQLLKGKKSPSH